MAAELIGTAYVRIKAITTGLGKEISDGVDKGVKDSQSDTDKSGKDLGDGLGKSAGKGLSDSLPDGITSALGDPDIDKASEDTGKRVSKKVGEGNEDENKKRNPFSSLIDSLTNIGKKFKFPGLKNAIDSSDIDKDSDDAGRRVASHIRKGIDDENEKKNPFTSLIKSFEGIFDKLPSMPAKGFLALLLPDALGAAGTLIQAALAPALAVLGSVATAALGAGAALGGVAAVALPGFGVLMAALKTDTKELQKFKKAAEGLLKPWKEVAVATQKTLLPGLQDALGMFSDLIPLFTEFGSVIGGVVGNFARMAAGILTSDSSIESLGNILESSTVFFENMTSAGLSLVSTVLPLFEAMAPLAEQLSGSLKLMAEHFATFIAAKSESGELTSTFQTWYDRLATIARIIGDVALGLFNILNIGATWGGEMMTSLEGVTTKFKEWTSSTEGKTKIEEWFDRMRPLAHELFLLFKDIGKLVFTPVFDGSKVEGMTNFVKDIREDWLPLFQDLMDALSGQGLGDALKGLADSIVDLITAAGGTGTLSSTIGTLTLAIDGLATLLSNPIVQAIAPVLVTIAGGIAALSFVMTPVKIIVGALGSLGDALALLGLVETGGLAGLFSGLAAALSVLLWPLVAVAAALAAFFIVWKNWDTIEGWIKSAWEWFTKLSTPMKILTAALAGLIALTGGPLVLGIAAIVGLVAVFKHFDEVKEWLIGAWGAVQRFVLGLPEMLAGLPAKIGELLSNLGQAFLHLPETIGNALSGLGSRIGDALSGVPDALRKALLGGIQALPGLILDALGGLADIGGKIIGFLANGIRDHIGDVVQFFVELPVKILKVIGTIAGSMLSVGADILKFLVMGLVQYGPQVLAFFLKLPFEIMTLMRKAIQFMVELGIDMIVALVKGLIDAAPRVITWFQDLPGNIISWLGAAASWLLAVGGQIIDGMWQGIQTSWDTVLAFFMGLPAAIGGFFTSAATFLLDAGGQLIQGLWTGAQGVWDSFNEFLVGLPAAAATAIGDFFVTIWGGIAAGSEAFLTNVGGWITNVVQFFIDLPGKVLGAVGDLGATIWGAISGGFATALSNIGTWVSDAWNKLVDFATQAPGKVAGFVTSLPGKIGEATSSALTKLGSWVTDALNKIGEFVSGVPGKLLDLASKMTSSIGSAASSALISIGNWVTDALNKVGTFVSGIPGKLAGAASDLASGVFSALKRAWNAAVGMMPSIHVDLPGPLPTITFGLDFLKFAQGGIIPGSALGTAFIGGEGGRAEAIVPMTRPSRALAVMQEAGLDKLILRSYLGGTVNKSYGSSDVTMLRIDHANIVSPVDTDMVVQKIASAYRRAS